MKQLRGAKGKLKIKKVFLIQMHFLNIEFKKKKTGIVSWNRRSQRTDWRTERKLNSETFGVPSMRRGGYRGRGYHYNTNMMGNGNYFNMGQRYRGGYRGPQRGGQRKHPGHQQGQGNSQPNAVGLSFPYFINMTIMLTFLLYLKI